jgi:GntR family trehalose operon transcriptional repressor
MPKSKYDEILKEIRSEIDSGRYRAGDYLPSENEYARQYGCTRNTIRRALGVLTDEGYVIPQHGKGVQVIPNPIMRRNVFTIGGIESFREAAARSEEKIHTSVLKFERIICDHSLSNMTGFDEGSELYYIERNRIMNAQRVILDTNIFLASETPGLSKEIAEQSIYEYLEKDLGMTITTSRRTVTAERATARDEKNLDLGKFDFLLVVTGQVFNSKGIMFEWTQSRHRPDKACFTETAVRKRR